jgi:hypothetical protein
MAGCTSEDEVVGAAGGGGQSERNAISEIGEALASEAFTAQSDELSDSEAEDGQSERSTSIRG